ncbi:MAG: hypothetical protein IPH75_07935 [bacterium]|nr:hypothetical protein [bacterium]
MNSLKICAVIVIFLLVSQVMALPPLGRLTVPSAAETNRLDYEAFVNSNNIFAFVTNQGMMFRDLAGVFGHDYGFFYPYTTTADIVNGTNTKSVMYSAGLWMFGKTNGELRGAVAIYSSEYYPGPMLGTSFDPNGRYNPDNRVYKLYADSMESNPNYDYIHWPVDQGAPLDANGKPLLLGRQTLYAAYNESSTESVWDNRAGTLPPLGIEVHQTVWGYGKSGDDTLFFPNYYPVSALDAGSEVVEAVVANPHAITGHDYLVEVVPITADSAYWRLIDRTIGATVLDYQYNFTGDASSPVVDGLRIQVKALGIRFSSFQAVANAAGPIDPPEPAAANFQGFPTPGDGAPTSAQQTTGQRWLIHTADNGGSSGGGTRGSYEAFLSRTTRDGTNWPEILKGDYEFRFTGAGNYGIREADFGSSEDSLIPVPFEVWDIGKDTPADPSDDVRLIPLLLENGDDGTFNLSAYGAGNEHSVSGADNDPFTDWVYLYRPSDPQPGEQGYNTAVAAVQGGGDYDRGAAAEILARLVFVAWNGGEAPPFVADMPETGTVFQILASEGFVAVDSFAFTATVPTFQTAGGDGNALYVKYDLFNKGGRDIQDMYISIWGDPDLGTSSDDLTACDTINHVYYTYNGDYSDAVYGVRCPAVGFTVLQGPIVPSPGDIAVSFGRAVPNYRNMDVTAFVRYYNGIDPNSSTESYNYMRGLNSDGSPLPNGSKFMVPGDPISMTGDLDVNPADRRIMGSIGPISMAPGDSQQVIVKWGVGQGEDRLQSITDLKLLLQKRSQLTTSLDSLYFTADSLVPPGQQIVLTNAAQVPFDWQADHTKWWLTLSKKNGAASPDTILIAPNAILPRGIYRDTITISSYDNSHGLILIPVTYRVSGPTCCVGTTGNVDGQNIVTLSDLSLLIAYLTMTPRPELPCFAEANINTHDLVDLSDLSYLIAYLTVTPAPTLPDCPVESLPLPSGSGQ